MSYPDAYPGYYGANHGGYPVHTSQPHGYRHKYGAASVAGYDGRSYDRYKRPHHDTMSDKGPYYEKGYPGTFDNWSRRHYRDEPVVSSQPKGAKRMQRQWQTGLCDCHKDMNTCLCVWCCSPCYQWYLLEKDFGESCWSGVCMGAALSFLAVRYRFRDRNNIEGSLLEDCCTMTWCELCAVCQMKREKDMLEDQAPTSLAKHMEERAQKYRY